MPAKKTKHDEDEEYIDVVGVYPGMCASKFQIKRKLYNNFVFYNSINDRRTWFVPCKDSDGDEIHVDMNKLLAFYVLSKPRKS